MDGGRAVCWTVRRCVKIFLGAYSPLTSILAQVFLPVYEEDERFREACTNFEREAPVSRTYRGRNTSVPYMDHEDFLPDGAYDISTDRHDGVPIHRDQMQRSFSESRIQTAVVETLLGLLYGLSNQTLADTDRETLVSMIDAPAWNSILPHFRDALAVIDTKIVQAVAEGLFKESLRACHHRMLDLSLALGADPTQRISYFDSDKKRDVLSTPLAALCKRYRKVSRWNPERLILSLLERDPHVSNCDLLWIIRARFYDIAESVVRGQSGRSINFAIPRSDLGEDFWIEERYWPGGHRRVSDLYHPVTPLLVACFDMQHSPGKLALIRCLLERSAQADLEAMVAAAGSCDTEAISLLHRHRAPVNGYIPHLGSPLSSACKLILHLPGWDWPDLAAIPLLLELGATPHDPKNLDHDDWQLSPLHILALAEDWWPEVTETFKVLLEHGADINRRAKLSSAGIHEVGRLNMHRDEHWRLAETPLEYALWSSRWISAMLLLSADCELTGREILFINSTLDPVEDSPREEKQTEFRKLLNELLAKAPSQATAEHWSGLTVLQKAIENAHEDMILALFSFGLKPAPSDFLYMLGPRAHGEVNVCRLSNNIQMKLVLDAPIAKISTFRLMLATACAEAVRYALGRCPDVYDSRGLCDLIARLVSKDRVSYYRIYHRKYEDQQTENLTLDDLRAFISRRTMSNRDEDWESTAVTIAARAGRADILRMLIEPGPGNVRSNGLVPLTLLKSALIYDNRDPIINKRNWCSLGVWINYCRMDDPNTRCSPLTAAAMVVPETAAEETVDHLLALNYQPDCWTVLVASFQGRLSILQRLERLECWPQILDHEDRPDWCPTALQTAVYNEHVSTVRFLLDKGTMMNAIDLCARRPFCSVPPRERYADKVQVILPRTALQRAVEQGNMELVTILVRAGADVNAPAAMDSGATALQIASIQGDIPMMDYLIRQGADPCAAGAAKHGRTALQGAAEHGRKDAVELLLTHSYKTTSQSREHLIKAVYYAEKNANHIVASVLRETLFPQWSSEDEGTRETLSKESDSSSEHSVLRESRRAFEEWDLLCDFSTESQWSSENEEAGETLSQDRERSPEHPVLHESTIEMESSGETAEDGPGSVREPHESNSNSGLRNGEPGTADPMLFREGSSRFLQEMQLATEGHGELGPPQIEDFNFPDGDGMSEFTFRDDTAAWIDDQLSLGGLGVDDMSFDDFFWTHLS